MKLMKLNIQLFATTLVDLNQSVGSVGGGSNRFKFYEKVTINSQDIENNTTNITITHLMTGTWGGFEGFYSPESTISTQAEDGTWTTRKTTVVDSFSTGETKTIGEWTGDVPHNSDGSLRLNFKCEFHPNTTAYYYLPADSEIISGYVSLPTIPRASSVGVTDSDIGATATIIINKTSSNFKHTLRWECGSLSGTIATKTSNQTVAWTVPTDLYELIPNSLSTTVTVYCDTYSKDTLVGTKQTTFKANVNQNENKPDVSATLRDVNSDTYKITGDYTKLIKFFSNVETVISATAKNSATIKSYKVVCGDGKTATTQTSTINGVESGTFNIYVTDSRGLTTKIEKTLTMDPYVKLTLNAEIGRVSSTGSTAKISVWGNFYVGPSSEKGTWATLSLMYRYRETGTDEWSGYTEIADNVYYGVSSSNWNNYYLYDFEIEGNFSYTKQYEFEFIASDELMKLTSNQILKVGQPNHWWNKSSFTHNTDVDLIGKLNVEDIECKNKLTLGCGTKISNGLTTISNGSSVTISGTITSNWADLNDYVRGINIESGNYTFSVQSNLKALYVIYFIYEDGTEHSIGLNTNSDNSLKITFAQKVHSIRMVIDGLTSGTTIIHETINFQLEKGNVATKNTLYKKFSYNEKESMGNIVVDDISSKNKWIEQNLDTNANDYYYGIYKYTETTDHMRINISPYSVGLNPCTLNVGDLITYSFEIYSPSDFTINNIYFCTGINGNIATNYVLDNISIHSGTQWIRHTIYVNKQAEYIGFNIVGSIPAGTTISKIQIENGDVATNYKKNKKYDNSKYKTSATMTANSTKEIFLIAEKERPILLSLTGTGANFETHEIYSIYRINQWAMGINKISEYNYNNNNLLNVEFENTEYYCKVKLTNNSSDIGIYVMLTVIDLF